MNGDVLESMVREKLLPAYRSGPPPSSYTARRGLLSRLHVRERDAGNGLVYAPAPAPTARGMPAIATPWGTAVVLVLHRRSIVKVREVIRMLEREGWRIVRQRGSHRQLKHPFRKGVVTIAGREGADLPLGTLKSIYRQAGIRR